MFDLNEQQECELLVQYLELKKYKFTHIHNEMYTKSWSQKRKAKNLGVKSGVPDYLIIVNNQIVFIEMKRAKKGLSKVSDTQKEWIDALNNCQNVEAKVCYGAQEAISFLDEVHEP